MRRNSQDMVGKYHDRAVICALHTDVFTPQLKREMLDHYYQSKDLEVTFQWVKERLRKEDADKMKMLVKEEQKKQKELEQNEVCL
jgi:hypothetical protein